MKKHFIALAALVFSFQLAHAQTEKGDQTLGLNLNYYHLSSSLGNANHSFIQHNSQENWGIGPLYGYFVANNWEVGISPGYNRMTTSNIDENGRYRQTQRGYGISAFVNRYFLYDHKFGFRTGGYLGYGHSKSSYVSIYSSESGLYSNAPTNDLNDNYTVGANIALVYFPTPQMGLTLTLAGLSYTHNENTSTTSGGGRSDTVNFNATNNNLGVSVFFVFGGK